MAKGPSLFGQCAERIALLELLGNVPVPPSRNSRPPNQRSNSSYSLPEDTERHLTMDLAILTSLKKDIYKVTAVCVCEDSSGLSVLVAKNAANSHDSSYMDKVKSGLEKVFEILYEVSQGALRGFLPTVSCLSDGFFSIERCRGAKRIHCARCHVPAENHPESSTRTDRGQAAFSNGAQDGLSCHGSGPRKEEYASSSRIA